MSEDLQEKQDQNISSQSNHPEVDKAKFFYDFLNGNNFAKAVDAFIQNKQADNQTFLSAYRFDLILVGILLIAVLVSGYLELIDKLSTGTLIGAIVGYVLGSFRRE